MATEDELIAQYSGITGASAAQARQFLEAFDWNLETAIEDHYARQQDSDADPDYQEPDDEPVQPAQSSSLAPGGGHRLGDGPSTSRPVPTSAAPSTSSSSKPKAGAGTNKRFATLGDVSSGNKDDSDSDDEPPNLYAGGDKSGLAVQNPDQKGSEDLKKKIIEKARKGGRELADDDAPPKRSFFKGNAHTLGGDDTPSREIRSAPEEQPVDRVKRILHFWQDGFSIDDGDLYRFDDQANAQILQQIRSGRAPLHIMNVGPGQEVDVNVVPHEEKYVKPKKVYKPFEGQGNRLGSPTPGASSSSVMPGTFTQDAPAATAPSTASPQPAASQVDESKPTITLRISLGTGTRLTSRFNTDQTMGDVYEFVRRAESGGARSFVLQTTFPTKELTDHSVVLGNIPEFKRGGAIVQKDRKSVV